MSCAIFLSMKEKNPWLLMDHDGTLTDSDLEAREYREIVLDYMSSELGVPREEMKVLLERADAEIESKKEIYGWKIGDIFVAPATSDHYVKNTVAGSMALEMLAKESTSIKQFTDPAEVEKFVGQVFRASSPKLGVFYKWEAERCLRELNKTGRFMIITNSDPKVVLNKMTKLLGDDALDFSIVGNAKKYLPDPTWTGVVPEGMYKGFPGFPERGVNLQRKIYYMTLLDITSGDLTRAKMAGDIAELDLLMLDYLGAETALVLSATTPAWENNYYYRGEGKRFTSGNLNKITDWFLR